MDKRMTLAMLLFNNQDRLSKQEKADIEGAIRTSHLYSRNGDLEGAMDCVDETISQLTALHNG